METEGCSRLGALALNLKCSKYDQVVLYSCCCFRVSADFNTEIRATTIIIIAADDLCTFFACWVVLFLDAGFNCVDRVCLGTCALISLPRPWFQLAVLTCITFTYGFRTKLNHSACVHIHTHASTHTHTSILVRRKCKRDDARRHATAYLLLFLFCGVVHFSIVFYPPFKFKLIRCCNSWQEQIKPLFYVPVHYMLHATWYMLHEQRKHWSFPWTRSDRILNAYLCMRILQM